MMEQSNEFLDILNKLFLTFTSEDRLEDTIRLINKRYTILFNKIFIFESPQSKELMCTYNIDLGNVSNKLMENTILVHRKKETNTLYTINALNVLVKSLNNGYLDKKYVVDWLEYKNCVLLTDDQNIRRLDTSIYNVINLEK